MGSSRVADAAEVLVVFEERERRGWEEEFLGLQRTGVRIEGWRSQWVNQPARQAGRAAADISLDVPDSQWQAASVLKACEPLCCHLLAYDVNRRQCQLIQQLADV